MHDQNIFQESDPSDHATPSFQIIYLIENDKILIKDHGLTTIF